MTEKKKNTRYTLSMFYNVNQWLFYVIEAVSGINMKTEVLITCICIKPTFSTNNSGSISIVMYYIDSL